jgi:glutaminyl-peptide cyclotransferase
VKNFVLGLALTAISLLVAPSQAAPNLSFEIVAERSHSSSLFTQGLLVDGGLFYESSGLYGRSLLVSYPIAEPSSSWAKISHPYQQQQSLPENYFAEGLALMNEKLYLLTWQEKSVLIYDKKTLHYLKRLNYEGEGWGLTSNGKLLIRSDGSNNLHFHHPDSFAISHSIKVHDGATAVTRLNELEFAKGFIWANIWYDNHLVKIDPQTGAVVASLDLTELTKALHLQNTEAVLNGIAWDQRQNGFWVTGKYWPKMYLIRVQE